MTSPVDFNALQADAGTSVSILSTTTVTSAGTGAVYTGFSSLDRLDVIIDVSRLLGKRDPSLTVTVEQSVDGNTWETVTAHTFKQDGKHQFTVDAPKDQWRVSWAIAGGVRQCVIRSVTVVPGIFDEPRGVGGAGSSQQLVVQEITAAEVAASWDDDQAAIALDGIAPGDLVQSIWADENSLDPEITFTEFCAYLPEASTANVDNNAERMNDVLATTGSQGTYRYTVTKLSIGSFAKPDVSGCGVIKSGAQAYALFHGDAAPVSGTLVLKMLVAVTGP